MASLVAAVNNPICFAVRSRSGETNLTTGEDAWPEVLLPLRRTGRRDIAQSRWGPA
jgi:hypothetical protein